MTLEHLAFLNKTITCGEGGMVVTNSKLLAEKASSLKNLSYGKINKFVHEDVGLIIDFQT